MLFWFLIIILFIVFFYFKLKKNKQQKKYNKKSRAKLICYYSYTCPFCKSLMESNKWKEVEDYFNKNNEYDVEVIKYEETENPEKINEAKITGLPTIKLIVDNSSPSEGYEFDGQQDSLEIINFVKKIIQ